MFYVCIAHCMPEKIHKMSKCDNSCLFVWSTVYYYYYLASGSDPTECINLLSCIYFLWFSLPSRASVASRCFNLDQSHTWRQDKHGSIFGGKTLPPASSIQFLQRSVYTVESNLPLVPLFLI